LIIIATTNRMDLVDPALVRPGRFDYVVRFDAPDEEGRLEIFKIHTKEMQIQPSILKELARMSQGFVGSDIESLCRRARLKAIQRHLHSHGKTASAGLRPRVSMGDFQAPLEEIKRRIDDEQDVA
jgi:transitional endoplasmic reticulum ATPase